MPPQFRLKPDIERLADGVATATLELKDLVVVERR